MVIEIIYEDEEILIISKPAGITVNRAETTKGEETIQDWMDKKFSSFNFQFSNKYEEGNLDRDFWKRSGVVHRLDKETSGILILAKTPEAFIELQRQFRERVVKKTYVALAHGKVIPEEGEINVPVGRLPWNRMRFGILPGGRESVTYYKVRNYFFLGKEQLSFLELYPKTGRTHQIRVHLKYTGHPIFADYLYAGRKTAKKDRKLLNRVFLHAAGISFVHPRTGKEITLDCPLPEELNTVIKQLIQ